MDPLIVKTPQQKMIELCQGEYAPVVIELVKSVMIQMPLLGDSEFATVVNAVRLETQSDTMNNLIKRMDEIKAGALHQITM